MQSDQEIDRRRNDHQQLRPFPSGRSACAIQPEYQSIGPSSPKNHTLQASDIRLRGLCQHRRAQGRSLRPRGSPNKTHSSWPGYASNGDSRRVSLDRNRKSWLPPNPRGMFRRRSQGHARLVARETARVEHADRPQFSLVMSWPLNPTGYETRFDAGSRWQVGCRGSPPGFNTGFN